MSDVVLRIAIARPPHTISCTVLTDDGKMYREDIAHLMKFLRLWRTYAAPRPVVGTATEKGSADAE